MTTKPTQAEKKTEDWMTSKWRPLMAITYMATIWFDFILGPILFNVLQYYNPGQAVTSWTPLTLQGGGLYHLAMGAILGISAYTRGKEKVAAIENEKSFSEGFEGTPVASPSAQPQWVTPPTQGVSVQQTWAQSPAPTPAAAPAAADDSGFGSGFGDAPAAPASAPTVEVNVTETAPAPTDSDRPLRRKKIS
jgi:hypothetical protein